MDYFVDIELTLHPQSKSHLIMTHDPFIVLLKSPVWSWPVCDLLDMASFSLVLPPFMTCYLSALFSDLL